MTSMPDNWGARPVLCHLAGWSVPAYPAMMLLAVVVGLLLFWRECRRAGKASEHTFLVLLGALFGGALGSKVPMIMLYGHEMVREWPDLTLLVTSRSIVGGLIGGAVGVWWVKRRLGVEGRRGNLFVPGIAAGVAIGRLGCFMRGCCYGKPTTLPWGADFGDGISRHPTQLYESIFMIFMFGAGLLAVRRHPKPEGEVFKVFMLVYFAFRFVIEFVREEPAGWLGLSLFQWMSAAMVVFYATDWVLLRREGLERSP